MHRGTVEERPLGKSEVSNGVPEVETLDVGPVFLGIHWRRIFAPSGIQRHRAIQCTGEDLIEIPLLARGSSAIRQSDTDWRYVRTRARRLDECRAKAEERRPFPGIFGGSGLPISAVY